jgi:predicted AAA+ superfamily ATPase
VSILLRSVYLRLLCSVYADWTKTMYIPRTLEETLKKTEKQFPVLLVTGPRQVGKTTLLTQMAKKNRTYVTLDSAEIL